MMIVYGIVSQTSIARLFLAGVVPGLVMMVLFMGYVVVWALVCANAAPPGARPSAVHWRDVTAIVPPVVLIVCVIGAIYGGLATPTESAAIGVAGAALLAARPAVRCHRSMLTREPYGARCAMRR